MQEQGSHCFGFVEISVDRGCCSQAHSVNSDIVESKHHHKDDGTGRHLHSKNAQCIGSV